MIGQDTACNSAEQGNEVFKQCVRQTTPLISNLVQKWIMESGILT